MKSLDSKPEVCPHCGNDTCPSSQTDCETYPCELAIAALHWQYAKEQRDAADAAAFQFLVARGRVTREQVEADMEAFGEST